MGGGSTKSVLGGGDNKTESSQSSGSKMHVCRERLPSCSLSGVNIATDLHGAYADREDMRTQRGYPLQAHGRVRLRCVSPKQLQEAI